MLSTSLRIKLLLDQKKTDEVYTHNKSLLEPLLIGKKNESSSDKEELSIKKLHTSLTYGSDTPLSGSLNPDSLSSNSEIHGWNYIDAYSPPTLSISRMVTYAKSSNLDEKLSGSEKKSKKTPRKFTFSFTDIALSNAQRPPALIFTREPSEVTILRSDLLKARLKFKKQSEKNEVVPLTPKRR